MRDRRRELPDHRYARHVTERGAILRGAQFRSFTVGHVERDTEQSLRATALRASARGHPANAAIGLDNPIFDIDLFVRRKRLRDGALEVLAVRRMR